jgi:hypothetical protein
LHAGHWTLPRNGHTYNPVFGQIETPSLQNILYTDKKENQIFLIDKEIQNGAVAKSNMTNGLLIYGEIFCAFPHILGSPSSSYMILQLLHSEFPYV